MTITLSPKTEALLQEKAESEGGDLSRIAEELILSSIEWDRQERQAIIAGVLRGQEDFAAGRYKSLTQFIEEKRAKFGFSANWPHDVELDEENAAI